MPKKLSETQPTSSDKPPSRRLAPIWIWGLIIFVLIGGAIAFGSLGGYISAGQARTSQQAAEAEQDLGKQLELGVQDLEEGRYEVAKQRFEYIITIDPDHPEVMDLLAQSMAVLYATATPTALPATPSPTPTRDTRPIEELYNQALSQFSNQDWDAVVETLSNLRKEDRAFQVASVDGMLYMTLRSRGVIKILQSGNLEAGIYDLALADRFGPLDVDANQARQWARLYIFGLSFWEVHPEQAVFYFSQVAAAVPYLSDGSGWTAAERYRVALIQYGDLLASQGDWCEASVQYELSLALRTDTVVEESFKQVTERCLAMTVTPTIDATPTLSPTDTLIPGTTPTPTTTLPNLTPATPTATQSQITQTPTTQVTQMPTAQSTTPPASATHTEMPAPTQTHTPEAQITPTPETSGMLNGQNIGQYSNSRSSGAVIQQHRSGAVPIWWHNLFQQLIRW